MAEPSKLIPKKRKTSMSEPHRIFTRSEAQIYIHPNRSGRARIGSFSHLQSSQVGIFSKTQFQSLVKTPRGSQNLGDKDDWSRTPIKDLRAHRVFSPASIPEDCGYGEESKRHKKAIEEGSKGNGFNGDCLESLDIKDNSDSMNVGEQKTRTDDANEEACVQATPPDTDIFGCQYDDKVSFPSQPLMGGLGKGEGFQDKNTNNASASRSVSRMPARVKVFRAPGSFSYRRLLPYLMDITKDNPSASGKVNCPKIESQLTLMDSSKRDRTAMDNLSVDSGVPSKDEVTIAKNISDGNNLDSTSIVRDTAPSKKIDPENNTCMKNSLPTSMSDECCSKSLVNEDSGGVVAGDSCEDKSLINSGAYLPPCTIDTPFVESYGDQRAVGKEGNDGLDANDNKPVISGIVENHTSENDDVCQDSCALKLNEAGFCKEFDVEQRNQSKFDQSVAERNVKTSGGGFSKELYIDPKFLDIEEKGKLGDPGRKDDDKNHVMSDGLDHSINESVHMTGSDGCNLSKTDKFENVSEMVNYASQNADQVLGKPFLGGGPRHNNCTKDKMMDCNSRNKLGLNPCSRLRLFKTPGSLNYRRLLPYLTDIGKDTSGTSGNMHCTEVSKGPKEILHSSTNSDLHKSLEEKCENTNLTAKSIQKNVDSSERDNGTSMSSHSEELEMDIVDVRSDKIDSDVSNAINGSNLQIIASSLNHPRSFSGVSPHAVSTELSAGKERSFDKLLLSSSPDAKAIEVDSSAKSCQLSGSDFQGILADSSPKSILKRNPRGCRGSCCCLNCSSFRLNAEKAFEFSKNQMLDAEELAFYLISKLSDLRDMVEKSAVSSDVNPKICINQVKEACRKASEAEELARNRLRQMNYDLSIHCRITCGERPRVRFSQNVEERTIP